MIGGWAELEASAAFVVAEVVAADEDAATEVEAAAVATGEVAAAELAAEDVFVCDAAEVEPAAGGDALPPHADSAAAATRSRAVVRSAARRVTAGRKGGQGMGALLT